MSGPDVEHMDMPEIRDLMARIQRRIDELIDEREDGAP